MQVAQVGSGKAAQGEGKREEDNLWVLGSAARVTSARVAARVRRHMCPRYGQPTLALFTVLGDAISKATDAMQ